MIISDFSFGSGKGKNALLINPYIYDTRYWDKWSLPYGLLRIGTLLKNKGFKTTLIDCLNSTNFIIKKEKIGIKEVGDISLSFYRYGISQKEFIKELDALDFYPDQVLITSIMTYWWKSTKEVVDIIKSKFPKATVLIGGIYPSLCSEHALENIKADYIIKGEVNEASDLWLDLNLYNNKPTYCVVTSSRGCPYNCAQCAQKMINGKGVRHRDPEDVINEIIYYYEKFEVRKIAFYEDNILINPESHFEKILELIIKNNKKILLSAPEGFEVRRLYLELLTKMRLAGFKSIYLPLEIASLDNEYSLDQKNVKIEEFDRAVDLCAKAGFKPGIRQDLNAFILYGVPNQPIDLLIETILFAVHRVGNVTPMLYSPVPGSVLHTRYEEYFKTNNFDLEDLNGKLFPFWKMNNVLPSDYLNIQRLMYCFHTQFHGRPFDILEDSLISNSFRKSIEKWNAYGRDNEK